MFKVNDYVVYGLKGVCQIGRIGKDRYKTSDETQYYYLCPVYNNNLTIMVPVNNPNLVMRPISSKDDILSLVATLPEIKTAWIDDEKQRNNYFKAALKMGKPEELIRIIKTLYFEKQARSSVGKNLTKTDEDIFYTAKKHVHEEFAIALNISPDEVGHYLLEHVQ